MFALFFSLYLAMFRGTWVNLPMVDIMNLIKSPLNTLGEFFTSIFNNVDTPMTNLGELLNYTYLDIPYWLGLVAFVLALITSIGIVVVATKGIKKIFTVFFYGVR